MSAGGEYTSCGASERGARDFRDGRKLTQCPYPRGKLHHAWVAGWYAARDLIIHAKEKATTGKPGGNEAASDGRLGTHNSGTLSSTFPLEGRSR